MALKQESKLIQANIKDVQSGKSSAFEQLYMIHAARIYSFGLKFYEHNNQAAGELVKRVFIKAFEQINTFEGKFTFILWLRKLAVEEVRKGDIKKSNNKHRASPADEALFSIPAEERIAFILSDTEKLSVEEIVEITQNSAGEITARLEKARKQLMEKFDVTNLEDLDFKINFVSTKEEPSEELWDSIYNHIHSLATKDIKEEKSGDVLNVGDAKITLSEKLEKRKKEKTRKPFSFAPSIKLPRKLFIPIGVLVVLIAAVWFFFLLTKPSWEVSNLYGSPSIKKYNKSATVSQSAFIESNDILITDGNSKAVIKMPQGEIYLNPGSSIKRGGDVGEITIYYGDINIVKKESLEHLPIEVFSAKIEDYKAGSYLINMNTNRAVIYSESAGLIISSGNNKIYLISGYECEIKPKGKVEMPFYQFASTKFVEAVNNYIKEKQKENLNSILLESEKNDALTLLNILLVVDKDSRDIVINKLHSLVNLPADVNPYQMSDLKEKDILNWLGEIEKSI